MLRDNCTTTDITQDKLLTEPSLILYKHGKLQKPSGSALKRLAIILTCCKTTTLILKLSGPLQNCPACFNTIWQLYNGPGFKSLPTIYTICWLHVHKSDHFCTGVTDYFIPHIFHPENSIPYPGGYPGLSVKYPGLGHFISGSHLGSCQQNEHENMTALTQERYQQLLEYLRGLRISSPVYHSGFSANDKRGQQQQAATFEEKDGVLF